MPCVIGSAVEVIGFPLRTQLREWREIEGDSLAGVLKTFNVPESVEVLGDQCFKACPHMETIVFEVSSRLRRIGREAFAWCPVLRSVTIPALTEEIDGSAFMGCPLVEIQVALGSLNFKIEGNLLVTFDGAEIVRYFGMDQEFVVGKKVKVLGKSCFERCSHLCRIDFETGSELERIGPSALRDCESLPGIEIPPSVTNLGESSFEGCTELKYCVIDEDSSLIAIGAAAFAKCTSLRSFDIPHLIGEIGCSCFGGCLHLYRLRFVSTESMKSVIGRRSLDDALQQFGVIALSMRFRIVVEDGGGGLKFSGWVSVADDDGDLHLTFVRDLP
jgi:hypothetical protein